MGNNINMFSLILPPPPPSYMRVGVGGNIRENILMRVGVGGNIITPHPHPHIRENILICFL
jgi:hypothetical protein